MSEMNFKVPFSRLAIAIKLSTTETKREIKLKRTISSEYISLIQFKPYNIIPINSGNIDNSLNFFTISPPKMIKLFPYQLRMLLINFINKSKNLRNSTI
jgi:hypothetical protein